MCYNCIAIVLQSCIASLSLIRVLYLFTDSFSVKVKLNFTSCRIQPPQICQTTLQFALCDDTRWNVGTSATSFTHCSCTKCTKTTWWTYVLCYLTYYKTFTQCKYSALHILFQRTKFLRNFVGSTWYLLGLKQSIPWLTKVPINWTDY